MEQARRPAINTNADTTYPYPITHKHGDTLHLHANGRAPHQHGDTTDTITHLDGGYIYVHASGADCDICAADEYADPCLADSDPD